MRKGRQGAGSGRWESFERMVEVLNASVSIQQLADRMSAKGSSAAGRRIGAGCGKTNTDNRTLRSAYPRNRSKRW